MTRLRLVPCTIALLEAEQRNVAELRSLLGVTEAPDWPPTGGEWDDDAIGFFLGLLRENPSAAGRLGFYVCLDDALVASAGYFGPPEDATVEIGYSVAVPFRRQGIAREAVTALVERAREAGVVRVIARTRPDNAASVRVLESTGFACTGPDASGLLVFEQVVADPIAAARRAAATRVLAAAAMPVPADPAELDEPRG